MLDWIRVFGFPSSPLNDTFLLYKRITEQYSNPEILNIIRSLVPQDIVFKATIKENYSNIVPLLKWFKNEFMKWTPTEPVCENCINDSKRRGRRDRSDNNSSSSHRVTTIAEAEAATKEAEVITETPKMELKEIIEGNSWHMRKIEIYNCITCNYEFAFPRYGEILKIAKTKMGRCSEWSFLFGAILSSLGMKTRIVHDFLDHCWNEAILSSSLKGENWIHIDSTLDCPISINHPYYYEQNWKKEYQYVLAFTADKVEDVTKTYTLKWEGIQQRRLLKNKNNIINFQKLYSKIK